MPLHPYNPKNENDKQLVDSHRIFHAWISRMRKENLMKLGGRTREDIWNAHFLAKEEMLRRGFAHHKVDKFLDTEKITEAKFDDREKAESIANALTKKGYEVVSRLGKWISEPEEEPEEKEKPLEPGIQEAVASLKSFVVIPGFISLVGSTAEGKEHIDDFDFVIKLKSRNAKIEDRLFNQPAIYHLKDKVHVIYNVAGSYGKHIELYDLVAVKRKIFQQKEPEYLFPLFTPAPPTAEVPEGEGEKAFIHRKEEKVELLNPDGEMIDSYPEIIDEAKRMVKPATFILAGSLTSDGVFNVQDIFRWSSTELIQSPEEDRQFFLDKFSWTNHIKRFKNSEGAEFEEKITLMKPFLPLKTRAGYGKFEFNKLENLIKFWARGEYLEKGIAVQGKYDGFRLIAHKRGKDVKIFTEDKKRDRAENLTELASSIKALSPNELILDLEVLALDEKGEPQPRHEGMRIIAAKGEVKNILAYAHDCLWYNEPFFEKPYSERISAVRKAIGKGTKSLKVASTWIARSESELASAVSNAKKEPTSEGAMLKVLDSPYGLKGRTPYWAKLKIVKEVTMKIIGIRRKRIAGKPVDTFLYRGAVSSDGKLVPIMSQHKLSPKDMEEEIEWEMGQGFKRGAVGDYKYGETYGTNIKGRFGQLLTVTPIHILKFTGDDGKKYFSWMFGRVRNLETAKMKPDTTEDLESLAKEKPKKKTLEEFLAELKSEDWPITLEV